MRVDGFKQTHRQPQHFALPFGVFTGLGAGLTNSSLETPIGTLFSHQTFSQSKLALYVNAGNGNLVIETPRTPMIESTGTLQFHLIYNSCLRQDALATEGGWRLATVSQIDLNTVSRGTIELTHTDGHSEILAQAPQGGVFLSAPTNGTGQRSLIHDSASNRWVLFDPQTRLTTYFDKHGRQTTVKNALGHRTAFSYDSHNRLNHINAHSGCQYTLDWHQAQDGPAVTITYRNPGDTESSELMTHQWNEQGEMIYSRIGVSYFVMYQYSKSHPNLLLRLTTADQCTMSFEYTGKAAQLHAVKQYATAAHDATPTWACYFNRSQSDRLIQCEITDHLRGSRTLSIDEVSQQLLSVSADSTALSGFGAKAKTTYQYDPKNGLLTQITHPDGGRESFSYDDKQLFVLLEHRLPTGVTHSYYYNTQHALKPVRISEAVQLNDGQLAVQRTGYSLQTSSQDSTLLLELQQFSLSPEGRVTVYTLDDDNLPKTIRHFSHACYDLSKLKGPDDIPSVTAVQTWADAQPYQTWLRRDQSFDLRGQLISWTEYPSLNAQGKGVVSPGMHRVQRKLNDFGSVTNRTELLSGTQLAVTAQVLDPLQRQTRLSQIINASLDTVESASVYVDSGALIHYQNNSGLLAQGFANAAGLQRLSINRGLSDLSWQSRSTYTLHESHAYATVQFDAQQQPHLTFHTVDGDPWYDISATGRCTITTIDPVTGVHSKTVLANPVQLDSFWPDRSQPARLSEFLLLGLPPVLESEQNRTDYECYDQRQLLRYQIDASGYVTEHRYDQRGLRTAKIQYQTALTTEQLEAVLDGQPLTLPLNLTVDRAEQWYYDQDGSQIGHMDADGYITQTLLNAAGQITQTICYATPNGSNALTPDLFAGVDPVADITNDATTYHFYNQMGRLIAEVAPNGKLTTKTYYGNGHLQSEITYATPVASSWFNDPSTPPNVPSSTNDHQRQITIDNLGRETRIFDSRTGITDIQYTKTGQVTSRIQYAAGTHLNAPNPDTQRGIQTQYNTFGQPTHQANAFVSAKLQASPNDADQIWQDDSTRMYYSETGLHIQTTNSQGYHQFFYYDAEGRVAYTVDENYSVTQHVYNNFSQVSQKIQFGTVVDEAQRLAITGGVVTQEIIERFSVLSNSDDRVDQFSYNHRGEMTQHIDGDGFVWQYTYNAFGEKMQAIEPISTKPGADQNARTVNYDYDGRGHLIKKTTTSSVDPSLAITEQWRFDNLYGQQTQHIDGAGGLYQTQYDTSGYISNQVNPLGITTAEYTRDVFGRVVSVTNAENQVTRTVYDDSKLQRTITPPIASQHRIETYNIFSEKTHVENVLGHVGEVEHHYDGSTQKTVNILGQTTQRSVNLLGQEIQTQDKLGTQTAWQRGPGQQIHSKTAASNESTLQLTTTYAYNTFSEAEKVTDPMGIETLQGHNKRGLKTQVIQDTGITNSHLNLMAHTTYSGLHRPFDITKGDIEAPMQYTQSIIQDSIGRTTGKIIDPQGLQITTRKQLDGAGRVIARTDGRGNTHYRFYDAAGLLRFKISPTGRVAEKTYWPSGKLRTTRQYVQFIDLQKVSADTPLADIISAVQAIADLNDSLKTHFHNANLQPQYVIAANGGLTEQVYDDAGRVIQTTLYATAIAAQAWVDWTNAEVANWISENRNPSSDIQTYYVRNSLGQAIYVFDAQGYVTEHRYNANGQLIQETRYANAVSDPASIAALPLNEVASHLTPLPARDRSTFHVYNALGWPTYLVRGTGSVTQYQYNRQGKRTQVVMFAKTLTDIPEKYSALVAQLEALQPDPKVDRITLTEYDAVGRKTKVTDPNGFEEHFQYDSQSNLVGFTNRNDAHFSSVFDSANRETQKATPEFEVSTMTPINDGSGLLASNTQLRQVVTAYDYDDANNKTSMEADAGQDQSRITHYNYDADNLLQSTQLLNVRVNDSSKSPSLHASARPETVETLTRSIYRDGRGLSTCVENAEGGWTFHVYGPDKKLRYRVTPGGAVTGWTYNTQGKATTKTAYATRLTDLSAYQKVGIPLAVMKTLVDDTNPDNRSKQYVHDKLGRRIKETANTIVYASTSTSDQSLISDLGTPTVTQSFNAFNEVICFARLRDARQNLWAKTVNWYDKEGRKIASCDADGFVSIFTFDSFAQMVQKAEYATALAQLPEPSLQFLLLRQQIVTDAGSDRIKTLAYNLRGDKISETTHNQTVSSFALVDGKPNVNSQTQNTQKTFQHDGMGRKVFEQEPSGAAYYYYYNPLGKLRAWVGIGRMVDASMRYPLTSYYVNAFGERVIQLRSYQGTTAPKIGVLPKPIVYEARDRYNLRWLGRAGRVLVEQHGSFPTVRTWTRMGHLARETQQTTNTVPTGTKTQTATQYWYTTAQTYNGDGALTAKRTQTTLPQGRGTQYPLSIHAYQLNAFNETTAEAYYTEGETPTWHAQRIYDPMGFAWNSLKGGARVVTVRDLAGHQVVKLQDTQVDWNVVYNQLPSALLQPSATAEMVTRVLSNRGNVLVTCVPAATETGTATTTFQYSHWGEVLHEQRADGGEFDNTYGPQGHLLTHSGPTLTVTRATGKTEQVRPVTTTNYDDNGREVAIQNGRGHITGYSLDEASNPTQTVLGTGLVSQKKTYNLFNEVLSVESPHMQGSAWQYARDPVGKINQATDPNGGVHYYTYNERGSLASAIQPGGYRYFYTYDPHNNCVATYLPNGYPQTRTFDPQKRLLSQSDRDGYTKVWERDASGHVQSFTLKTPYGTQWQTLIQLNYNHDGKGQVTREYTNGAPGYAAPPHLSPAFDPKANQSSLAIVAPSPATPVNTNYQYQAGHVTIVSNTRRNQLTNIRYDVMGRRTQVDTQQQGVLLLSVQAQYNQAGQTVAISTEDVNLVLGYDEVGNNTYRSVTMGARQTASGLAEVATTINTFDAAERALIVGGAPSENGGEIGAGVLMGYANSDLRISETRAFGTNGQDRQVTNLGYDKRGRFAGLDVNIIHPNQSVSRYYGKSLSFLATGAIHQENASYYDPSFTYTSSAQTNTPNANTFHGHPMVLQGTYREQYRRSDGRKGRYYNTNTSISKSGNILEVQVRYYPLNSHGHDDEKYTLHRGYFPYPNGTQFMRVEQDDNWFGSINMRSYQGHLLLSWTQNGSTYYYVTTFDGIPFLKFKGHGAKQINGSNVNVRNYVLSLADLQTGAPLALFEYTNNVNSRRNLLPGGFLSNALGGQAVNANPHTKLLTTLTGLSAQNPNASMRHGQFLGFFFNVFPVGGGHVNDKGSLVLPGALMGLSYESLTGVADRLQLNGAVQAPIGTTREYTVQFGDTFESIAQAVLGDQRYADLIRQENGQEPSSTILTLGQVIRIPQVAPSHLDASAQIPAQVFANVIHTHLSQMLHIVIKQKGHPNYWRMAFKFIAIAVGLAFGQSYLGGLLIQSLSSLTGLSAGLITRAITAATAALTDLLEQGIAHVAFGQKIYWGDIADTALEAFTSASGTASSAAHLNMAERLLQAAEHNAASQLAGMMIHRQQSFDLNAVWQSMAMAGMSAGINKLTGFPNNGTDLTNTVVSSIITRGEGLLLTRLQHGKITGNDLRMAGFGLLSDVAQPTIQHLAQAGFDTLYEHAHNDPVATSSAMTSDSAARGVGEYTPDTFIDESYPADEMLEDLMDEVLHDVDLSTPSHTSTAHATQQHQQTITDRTAASSAQKHADTDTRHGTADSVHTRGSMSVTPNQDPAYDVAFREASYAGAGFTPLPSPEIDVTPGSAATRTFVQAISSSSYDAAAAQSRAAHHWYDRFVPSDATLYQLKMAAKMVGAGAMMAVDVMAIELSAGAAAPVAAPHAASMAATAANAARNLFRAYDAVETFNTVREMDLREPRSVAKAALSFGIFHVAEGGITAAQVGAAMSNVRRTAQGARQGINATASRVGRAAVDTRQRTVGLFSRGPVVNGTGLRARSLSDVQVRLRYNEALERLPSVLDPRLSTREQALSNIAARTRLKLEARELMVNQRAAAKLPQPQSLNDLVSKLYDRGLTGEALWKEAFESARRTNPSVNQKVLGSAQLTF